METHRDEIISSRSYHQEEPATTNSCSGLSPAPSTGTPTGCPSSRVSGHLPNPLNCWGRGWLHPRVSLLQQISCVLPGRALFGPRNALYPRRPNLRGVGWGWGCGACRGTRGGGRASGRGSSRHRSGPIPAGVLATGPNRRKSEQCPPRRRG